jgi:hypothetical protein
MRTLALILVLSLLPIAATAQLTDMDTGERFDPFELHGSVAISWYSFDDATDSDLDYTRPAARLNLKAYGLFGGNFEAKIRARTRYNDRSNPVGGLPETEWRNRVYEVSLTYDSPESPFGFQAGRIVAREMGGVGYVDGVLATHEIGESWSWGLLAGTRPDWRTADFQTDITKYGAFVGFERGDRADSRFEAKVAAVGEYHGATVSREFIYLRSSYHRERRLDLYATAELDANRGWREERSGERVTLSALYLRGRYRVSDNVTVGLGYDTRKNYITYEARSIPDSLFIDAARHGVRASVDVKMPAEVRMHAELGTRGIEDSGDDATLFYSAQFSRRNLLVKRLTGTARVSGFDSPYALGTQVNLRLRMSLRGGHSVHVGYGTYSYGFDDSETDRFNQWMSAGGTARLPARLYVTGEYQQDWGDDSEGYRVLGELGYTF